MEGLLAEHGPYFLSNDTTALKENPYAWNQVKCSLQYKVDLKHNPAMGRGVLRRGREPGTGPNTSPKEQP